LQVPTAADVQADARALPYADGSFDTVIVGDLLEHLGDADAVAVLCEAARVARARIIVTWPYDRRDAAAQRPEPLPDYAPGIPALHPRLVTRAMVQAWLDAAGLAVAREEPVDYPFAQGCGLVLEPAGVCA